MKLLNPVGNYISYPPQFTYNGIFYGLTIATRNNGYITFQDQNNATYPLAAMDRYYVKGTSFTITFTPDIIANNGNIYDNYTDENMFVQDFGKNGIPFVYPFFIALAQSANDPLPSQNALLNAYLKHGIMSFDYGGSLTQGSNIKFNSITAFSSNLVSFFSQRMKTLSYQITTQDVNAMTLTITGYYFIESFQGPQSVVIYTQSLTANSAGYNIANVINIGGAVGFQIELADTSSGTSTYNTFITAQIEED